MGKLLTLLFVFASIDSFCQEIKGKIRGHSNLKAIAYATVYYKKAEVGTYADSTGNFHIQKILGDTLILNAIGFQKHYIPVDGNTNSLDVVLTPLTINLNEVVITRKNYNNTKKSKSLRLGNLSSKHDIHISGIKGRTVAYLVKNDAGIKGQIKSIQYSINPKFSTENNTLVSAHLYTVNPDTGKPGADLLLNVDLLKVKKEEKNLVVDIAHLGIELPPGGIYIGLEWLGLSPWYTLSKSTKPTTVYAKFMGKEWQLLPIRKEQTTSAKNGKNKMRRVYFEEPNFTLTLSY